LRLPPPFLAPINILFCELLLYIKNKKRGVGGFLWFFVGLFILYILSLRLTRSLLDGGGGVGLEGGSVFLLSGSGDELGDGESELGVSVDLVDGSSASILSGDRAGSKDLDGIVSSSVLAGHLHVHLGDGTVEGDVSVFSVHVVLARSGLVSDGNTVSLDDSGVLLVDLLARDDLTVSSLQSVEELGLIPELRSSNNLILSEDSHGDDVLLRLSLSGESGTSDQELSHSNVEAGFTLDHFVLFWRF